MSRAATRICTACHQNDRARISPCPACEARCCEHNRPCTCKPNHRIVRKIQEAEFLEAIRNRPS